MKTSRRHTLRHAYPEFEIRLNQEQPRFKETQVRLTIHPRQRRCVTSETRRIIARRTSKTEPHQSFWKTGEKPRSLQAKSSKAGSAREKTTQQPQPTHQTDIG
jgi:hypothetical protein